MPVDALLPFVSADLPIAGLLLLVLLVFLLSAYVKIVTVLGILRIGLGTDSLPSALVTAGLALVLSFFVMYPTIDAAARQLNVPRNASDEVRTAAYAAALEQWRGFLSRHAHAGEKQRFAELALQLPAGTPAVPVDEAALRESWRVLAPAFVVSELKSAFATGLSLFLPFLVVDLIVAVLLVSVGLDRMSPVLVAFPFKLLLFVMVDGWSLIVTNLAATYAGGG